MLAFLDPQLDALGDAGHDLYVVATEAQLLGHQAGDGAAQDGLGAQGRVLLPEGQGPGGHRGWRAALSEVCCLCGKHARGSKGNMNENILLMSSNLKNRNECPVRFLSSVF